MYNFDSIEFSVRFHSGMQHTKYIQHQSQKAPKNLLIKNICNCVLPEGTIISRLRGYTYSALNRDQEEEGEGGLIIGGRGDSRGN